MPVTIRDCPHCYQRVGFNDDGVCPACSKRLSDAGADPSRTLFTITEGMSLSPVCHNCGCPTTRRVAVSKGTQAQGWRVLRVISDAFIYCVASVFRGALHVHDRGDRKHPYRRVRISLPLCHACQRAHGIPSPEHVDFDRGSMSFVVSREISTRL
jgi:hypothetical protein